jgi:hypothetical protein
MALTSDSRSRMLAYFDQLTGLGLRVGIPAFGIALVFLLFGAVSGKIQGISHMKAADQAQMIQIIEIASRMLVYGCAVVVFCVIARLFSDEVIGQALTIAGALFYFGSPFLLVQVARLENMGGSSLPRTIVDSFRTTGAICFVPGLILLLRDAIMRIWNGLSVKKMVERHLEEDGTEEKLKKSVFAGVYSKCWDMNFCRAFVRKVCPAYAARKSCWKIKVGCYCDEKTILKAMMSEGKENVHTRGIMKSLGITDEKTVKLGSKVRKQRCRRCGIYIEHQRQKYQILSPVVFPVVGALLYAFHERISAVLWVVLQNTDRIMSFLAYKTGTAAQSFSSDGGILTGLAFAWLSIIVISYSLRLLEYLIFELQV